MIERTGRAAARRTPDLSRRAAVLAERWAPTQCRSAMHGQDCSWYHAAWPMLRALGVVQGVDGDAAFFHDAIAGLAHGTLDRGGHPALVSDVGDQLARGVLRVLSLFDLLSETKIKHWEL